MNTDKLQLAGIIPAAGDASRLSPIPCSKEILPVGFQENTDPPVIKVAVSHLLESFAEAGADQIYIIMRKGKWDIPQYLGVGTQPGCTLAYIVTEPTPGTHYTIDLAYSFLKDRIVLLGFPDILFKPKNAFTALLNRQEKTGAEVVLGVFKTANPQKADMVDIDENGRIKKIVIKPEKTDLTYTWAIAVWTPIFTEYLHKFVVKAGNDTPSKNEKERELFIGDVIQCAIDDELAVEGVIFEDGKFVDIGTIPDLKRVWDNNF